MITKTAMEVFYSCRSNDADTSWMTIPVTKMGRDTKVFGFVQHSGRSMVGWIRCFVVSSVRNTYIKQPCRAADVRIGQAAAVRRP